MKRFLGITTAVLLMLSFTVPANAVDLKSGFKYGALASESGTPRWAKGVTTELNVLNIEVDSLGKANFKVVEELGYLEYGISEGVEGKILSAMTFGMFPLYTDKVWVGFGTGIYSYLRTDVEDTKAQAFGLRADGSWKRLRLGLGADAISLAGADDFYLHSSLGLLFE